MSLLNDALRKRKKQPAGTREPQIFNKRTNRRSFAPSRLAGIVVFVAVLVILAFTGYRYLDGGQSVPVVPSERPPRVVAQPIPAAPIPSETVVIGSNGGGARQSHTTLTSASPDQIAEPAADAPPATSAATAKGPFVLSKSQAPPVQTIASDQLGLATADPPRKKSAAAVTGGTPQRPRLAAPKPAKLPQKTQSKHSGSTIEDQATNPYYRKALRYHRQNDFKAAILMYRQFLAQNPQHTDASLNLAAAYIKIARFDEAYTMLKRLHANAPRNPKVILNLATAEIGLGRPEAALSVLSGLENRNDPPVFEVLFTRAVALSRLDRIDEALVWYQKAARLKPDHPQLLFNMAVAYDRLEKFNEAIHHYAAFLKQNPTPTAETGRIEKRIQRLKTYLAANTAAPAIGSN